MIRRPTAGALAPLLVLTASCLSVRRPATDVEVCKAVPRAESRLEIECSAVGRPAYRRAFEAVCWCAELTLARGFRYLRIYDREKLGSGTSRWKLELFHVLPPGAVLLDVAEPAWEGAPPDDGVLDASTFAVVCSGQPPGDPA